MHASLLSAINASRKPSLDEIVARFLAALQQVIEANPGCSKFEMAYPADASHTELTTIKDHCTQHGLKVTHLEGPPRMCIALLPVPLPEFAIVPAVPAPQPVEVVRDDIVDRFFRELGMLIEDNPHRDRLTMRYPSTATSRERSVIDTKCLALGFGRAQAVQPEYVLLVANAAAKNRLMTELAAAVVGAVVAPQPVATPMPAPEPESVRNEIVDRFFRDLRWVIENNPNLECCTMHYPAGATPRERSAINDKCTALGFAYAAGPETIRLVAFGDSKKHLMAETVGEASVYLPPMPVVMQQASGRAERETTLRKEPWYTEPSVVSKWCDVSECCTLVDGRVKVHSARAVRLAIEHQRAAEEAYLRVSRASKRERGTLPPLRMENCLAHLKLKMVLYLEQSAENDVADTYVYFSNEVSKMPKEAQNLVVSHLRALGHGVKPIVIKAPQLSRGMETQLSIHEKWGVHVIYRRPSSLDYHE